MEIPDWRFEIADLAALVPERVFQVGQQIFGVFDADGDAHEAVGDPQFVPRFLRDGGVGHRCGMRDQGFHSAKALAQRAELHAFQQPGRGVERTQIERDHRAEARHLLLGECGLLGVAEELVYGDLYGLAGLTGGLPLVAEQTAGRSGLVVSGSFGHDVTLVDQFSAFLLGGFAKFAEATMERVL